MAVVVNDALSIQLQTNRSLAEWPQTDAQIDSIRRPETPQRRQPGARLLQHGLQQG